MGRIYIICCICTAIKCIYTELFEKAAPCCLDKTSVRSEQTFTTPSPIHPALADMVVSSQKSRCVHYYSALKTAFQRAFEHGSTLRCIVIMCHLMSVNAQYNTPEKILTPWLIEHMTLQMIIVITYEISIILDKSSASNANYYPAIISISCL